MSLHDFCDNHMYFRPYPEMASEFECDVSNSSVTVMCWAWLETVACSTELNTPRNNASRGLSDTIDTSEDDSLRG